MKQKLKGGYEYDCVSDWRKKGILRQKAGIWKAIKRKMNKRFRKEGKVTDEQCEDHSYPSEDYEEDLKWGSTDQITYPQEDINLGNPE